MFQLGVAWQSLALLVETAHQALQFCDVLSLLPDVSAQQDHEDHETNRQHFHVKFCGANYIPGKPGEGKRDDQQDDKGEAPKLILTFAKVSAVRADNTSGLPAGRCSRVAAVLLFGVHVQRPTVD